jgi:hypothetical protein
MSEVINAITTKTLTKLSRKIGWDPTDHPGTGSYSFYVPTPIPM